MTEKPFDDIDTTSIIIKPLYFGLIANILVPAGFLFICYTLHKKQSYTPLLDEPSDLVFGLFIAAALALTVIALRIRAVRSGQPMITRLENFEEDIATGLLAASRPAFLLIAGIAVLGVIYYFLTAQFEYSIFLVIISFVIFQLVRPRHGSIRKLMERQWGMAQSGQLKTGP